MRPITARFPQRWKTTITIATGGRDEWGEPLPDPVTTVVEDCLFSPATSTDSMALSDVPSSTALLLTPPGVTVPSTAKITVPGHGEYLVDGTPDTWPMGTAIQLRRTGDRDAG